MTFRQLFIFLTVVDEGSFPGAAKKLGISQAAVSAQIGTLEKELEHTLFAKRRAYGNLELTSAGRVTRKAAATIIRTVNNLLAELNGQDIQAPAGKGMAEVVEVASEAPAGICLPPNL